MNADTSLGWISCMSDFTVDDVSEVFWAGALVEEAEMMLVRYDTSKGASIV